MGRIWLYLVRSDRGSLFGLLCIPDRMRSIKKALLFAIPAHRICLSFVMTEALFACLQITLKLPPDVDPAGFFCCIFEMGRR